MKVKERMKTKRQLMVAMAIAAVSIMAVQTVCAESIVYYRMGDDGAFTDDSISNRNVTAFGVTQTNLPTAGGAGSGFANAISGSTNDYAAYFDGANDTLYRSDITAFTVTNFTIEALVNSADGAGAIAGQWEAGGGANQRSWMLNLYNSGLYLTMSQAGSDQVNINSGITLETNKDYFVAASFDLSGVTATFYVQDLTAGTGMIKPVIHSLGALHDSTADFEIGLDADNNADFEGLIDEVRFSNTVLDQDELLVPVAASSYPIVYYRMGDDGAFTDDSIVGHDLWVRNNATQVTLPASGAGSDFPDPIDGGSNSNAAYFDGGNDALYVGDVSALTVTDFTIEALVNTADGDGTIAGQWDTPSGGGSDRRSWQLELYSSRPYLTLCEDGTAGTALSINSGITLTNGNDYFVAASFSLSDQNVRFYVKDLAAGTWQTRTIVHTLTALHDSTADFNIGMDCDWANDFEGLVDEVRLSAGILAESDLLVPKPAEVLGYYRMGDDGALTDDSSIPARNLTNWNVTQTNLPTASGAGADFIDAISGSSNSNAAYFGAGIDSLYRADVEAFAVLDFTIEALVNSTDGAGVIAGQWKAGDDQRAWVLSLYNSRPYLSLSQDGTTNGLNNINSGITLATNKDYFVAASFDLSDQASGVKFYVQDLAADTWQTSIQPHSLAELHNSTNNFTTGVDADNGGNYEGLIDELRFSAGVVEPGDLLVPSLLEILEFSSFSGTVMEMVVNVPGPASAYAPRTKADLTSGSWDPVAHSTNGVDGFATTNLGYSVQDGSKVTIYVDSSSDDVKFFKIIEE